MMLVSYIPKPRKNVLVVSSMHEEPHLSDHVARKPDMILFYNETKGGVDTVDQMIDTYRTKPGTRRWPMVVFYTIVDVAALNALVIMQFNNPRYFQEPKNKYRKHFLKDLGLALVLPYIEQRAAGNIRDMRPEVTNAMSILLGRQVRPPAPVLDRPTATKGKCFICVRLAIGDLYKKKKKQQGQQIL